MHQTTPVFDAARALRVMHFSLLAGVLLAGGVFVFLVQFRGMTFGAPQSIGTLLAVVSVSLLAVAATILRKRIPERRFDEAPEAYWAPPERRGGAIVLWASTEAAGLVGLIGYFLTGGVVPAIAAAIAIVTLAVFRPSHLEGAA